MAGQKLTDKTLLNEQPNPSDLLMVVDVNDTTGSSAGTSKKVLTQNLIATSSTALSNANIQALDDDGSAGSSFTLVEAPGSGFAIIPLQVAVFATYATSADTSNSNLYIGYTPNTTSNYWCFFNRIMNNVTTNSTYVQSTPTSASGGVSTTSIDNAKLSVWANNNFNGGWSATIYTTYQIIKL
tara:strand:+ start:2170 stop:2718 length:549 start_codon:yes stop_codon:yes gene_type:complete